VYWLDRNRKNILPHIKKWYETEYSKIFSKYEVIVPAHPFIPPHKYEEFKKEFSLLVTSENFTFEKVTDLFSKYETTSDLKYQGTKAIPVEKQNELQKEIKEIAEGYEVEFEYFAITMNVLFEQILKGLTGEEQLTLDFLLEEKSNLEVFSSEIQ